MAEETNHNENLAILNNNNSVENLQDTYAKQVEKNEKGSSKTLGTLESIVTAQDPALQGSFMTATPQAIDYAIAGYQDSQKPEIEKAIDESADYIMDQYITALLNPIIENIVEQVSEDEKLKDLPEEERKKILELSIYQNLAEFLAIPEYKVNSEEVEKLTKELEDLKDANEDKKNNVVKNYLSENGLGYMQYAVNTQNAFEGIRGLKNSLYRRALAKDILKDTKDGYVIDKDKFKELYGNEENYKKIATQLLIAQQQSD